MYYDDGGGVGVGGDALDSLDSFTRRFELADTPVAYPPLTADKESVCVCVCVRFPYTKGGKGRKLSAISRTCK